MGMYRYDYIVLGYDLKKYEHEIKRYFNKLEEEHRDFIIDDMSLYQSVGNIQLFNDPAGDSHLIYGLILCACNEYDGFLKPVDLGGFDLSDKQETVFKKLQEDFGEAFYCNGLKGNAHLIAFTEWR